jgi:uncharacterized protein YdaU (DUF1376 family)
MKAPYQPMFWGDHYAETRGLTFLQSVIYLQLQGAYWSNGGPLDDAGADVLARAIGCTKDEWLENAPAVLKFFRVRGGKIIHERLDAQLAAATRHSQSLKERGKKGGTARVINSLSTTAQAEVSNNGSSIPSQAKPSQEKKKESPKPPNGGLEGFEDFWQAYSRHDAKKAAEKAWPAALKAVGGDPSVLIQAAKAYSKPFVTRQKDRKWQALPASWLNGERWNDSTATLSVNTPKPVEPMQETLRRLAAEIKANPPEPIIPTWFKGD